MPQAQTHLSVMIDPNSVANLGGARKVALEMDAGSGVKSKRREGGQNRKAHWPLTLLFIKVLIRKRDTVISI